MTNENFKNCDRLVLVSYRLPFHLYRNKVVQNSGGLVSAVLALAQKAEMKNRFGQHIVWIGQTRDTPDELARVQKQVNDFELVPVHIEDRLDDKYYGGFCNDMIWPLFHYFPSQANFDEASFDAYRQANEIFAEQLMNVIRPADLVWIHDYHLMLLPGIIRERYPNANIGFFLHIPFPSFEIFRLMPRYWRQAILKGILGADLAGFHTFDYTQYFLRAVGRALGFETTMNSVIVDDRYVGAETFPLGIDYARFSEAAASNDVKRQKDNLDRILGKNKLIFSVDRLDYSKGLLHRLLGFERFLERYPRWRQNIVFNMVVIPSRESVMRYQEMKREIEAAVGRINGRYGSMQWQPVAYEYRSLSFTEMVALYDRSNVALITPIRDGMNLVAKEYIACQQSEPGVLILSEMAGAAAELSEAILINPTDKDEIADAIAKALDMPAHDRKVVLERMQRRLRTYDVFGWAADFFDTLVRVKDKQHILEVRLVNRTIENEIVQKYKEAARRIIFLDYDGTLVPFSRYPETAVPSEQLLSQLNHLASDIRNTVVIISGRKRDFLEKWFDSIPAVLVAEHGAFIRIPSAGWSSEVDEDQSWKEHVLPLFQRYADRCTGSFIEEKSMSLVWHYRNADPGISLLRSGELKDELRELVSHDSKLQVVEGQKIIEVKKSGYDKGTVALKLLAMSSYDFILAIGDDKTDEDLFLALPEKALTIKIGITASMAKYHFRDQQAVLRLMERLPEEAPEV